MRIVAALIVAALLAAGCGYRGPLYLPGSKPERKAKTEAKQPAPVQDKEEETK